MLARCSIEIVRGTPHTQQLLSGLLMLKRQGEVELRVHITPARTGRWPYIATVTLNDTVRVGYDTQDGIIDFHDAVREYVDSLAHFFVRSYRPGHYAEFEDRVHPLGLNYDVAVRHPLSLAARFRTPRAFARFLARRVLGYEGLPFVATFEEPPRSHGDGPIIFLTRTWEPGQYRDPGDQAFVTELNQDRANCVRALREAFGPRFTGGLQATPHALANFPDCVVDKSLTRKARYLRLVRDAAVCVTTEGLEHANGWKLGEYVAASKPIVATPLLYDVPGDFRAGVNYLPFSSPRDAVGAVQTLLDDPALAQRMSAANHDYYRGWVRPDALVRNSLRVALGPSGAAGPDRVGA
jgi:glycosyltransferase involved in cell wall biosynthesis